MGGFKMNQQLPKVYDPQTVEEKWYRFWVEKNYFHAEVEREKKPFAIVIPPPNVTGKLHLGHALNNTLQDILVRYHRMKGDNTMWIPGTDHAGIATQVKVEEELAKEGKSRYELGREQFLERVWAWKKDYGGSALRWMKGVPGQCGKFLFAFIKKV
jgi:valyl-tRNA synthetase